MTYERLIEIVVELGVLYTSRRESMFKLWQIEKDIEGKKLYLTPPDGWPGKNEEQRRTAQGQVFEKDETLVALSADLLDTRKKGLEVDDKIKVLENERRAIEWLIRSQLVQTLSLNHIDHDGGDVKDTAFDETAQAAVDQGATEQIQSWAETGAPPSLENEQSEYFERAFSPSGSDQLPDDLPF